MFIVPLAFSAFRKSRKHDGASPDARKRGGFGDERNGTVPRTKVCALEVWQELFKGDPKSYSQTQAREIIGLLRMIPGWRLSTSVNCGAIYGRQRGFVKEV